MTLLEKLEYASWGAVMAALVIMVWMGGWR